MNSSVIDALRVQGKTSHPGLGGMSKRVILIYRSFIVWSLTFKYLICLVVSFIYGVRQYSILFIWIKLTSFPKIMDWRDFLFSIVYSCILCHILIDHISMDSFLRSLFYSFDLCMFLFQDHRASIIVHL